MKVLKLIAMVGLACLLAQPTVADVRKSGLTGAAFLKIGVGARAGPRSARPIRPVAGDVHQLFWNPAGTALSGGESQVLLSHNSWIADLSHDAIGFTRDMGDLGTLGIGIVTLGLSDITADRDVVPQFVLDAGNIRSQRTPSPRARTTTEIWPWARRGRATSPTDST